jgi:uncharacterized membrane protein YeiH
MAIFNVSSDDPDGSGGWYTGVALGLLLCVLFCALCFGVQGQSEHGYSTRMFSALDVFATLAFALASAYGAASRFNGHHHHGTHPIVICVVGGIMTGVGGGLLRDVFVLHTEMPALLKNPSMFPAAMLGAMAGYQMAATANRVTDVAVNMMDSIALGVAIVVGTVKGHDFAESQTAAALNSTAIVCATLTACGGGLLRDLWQRHTPAMLGISLLWPVLGALFHTGLVMTLRRFIPDVQPDDLWFIVIPVVAAANVYVIRLREPDDDR